jgi:hypothetical protein
VLARASSSPLRPGRCEAAPELSRKVHDRLHFAADRDAKPRRDMTEAAGHHDRTARFGAVVSDMLTGYAAD